MKYRILFCTVLLLGLAAPNVFARGSAPKQKQILPEWLELGGYYKNLYLTSDTTDTKEGYYADINRLRLDAKAKFNEKWRARVAYDNEVIFNDFGNRPDFGTIRNSQPSDLVFWGARDVYADKPDDHIFADHKLYRAYVSYYDPSFQVTVGKQKIDWGRARFYSPMDLFNPINPLAVESAERIGADAINIEMPVGSGSTINAVYAAQDRPENAKAGIRFFHPWNNYDVGWMAGEFNDDTVVGGMLDGYMGGAGVRGEWTYTWADDGREFLRAVVGVEQQLAKLHVLLEYFYNGGVDNNDPSRFLSDLVYADQIRSMQKNLVSLWTDYKLTTLLTFNNYVIYDTDQQSAFVSPELKYNVMENFDVSAGAQLPWGSSDSEFGSYEALYYTQAQVFF